MDWFEVDRLDSFDWIVLVVVFRREPWIWRHNSKMESR